MRERGLPELREAELAEQYADIVRRIARDRHIRRGTARRRLIELLRFLDLAAMSDEPLMPSGPVDDAWRAFTEDVVAYESYCTQRFGTPIPRELPADADAYQRTISNYFARFGLPDEQIWPRKRRRMDYDDPSGLAGIGAYPG